MSRWLQPTLAASAFFSLGLLLHNHALSLLPNCSLELKASDMKPVGPAKVPTMAVLLPGMPDDGTYNQRSRIQLKENEARLVGKILHPETVAQFGEGRWVHRDTRVIFSATDNSDPRVNGRRYTVLFPPCYGPIWGRTALLLFIASITGLYRMRRETALESLPNPVRQPQAWKWHCIAGLLLFVLGGYCNTGTLAPYAITSIPSVDPVNGYLYHIDHPANRALFDLVNGADRKTWADGLLLRRILFPILIWPFAHFGGFEIGGTIGVLFWNVVAFAGWLFWVRRRWGDRACIAAVWLGAAYPGAAYWAGLPQVYALIFPVCLWLGAGLHMLDDAPTTHRLAAISLAMGVGYLAYDLFVFFIPASVLLLAGWKPWSRVLSSVTLQLLPMLLWCAWLRFGLGQQLFNSNSASYITILLSYARPGNMVAWWQLVSGTPETLADVFFGSNFIFLPSLFLGLLLLNTLSPITRLTRAESSLLLVAFGLFLFNNLAPEYGGPWPMRGNWIARLYQPVFIVLLAFAARWAGAATAAPLKIKRTGYALLAAAGCINLLVIFGPILNNPLHVSEYAFYRFYNHFENHWMYGLHLNEFGRRPLGFHSTVGK